MATAAISSGNNLYQTSISDKFSQKKQYSQDLASSLESGNMSGAQSAFAQLLQQNQNSGTTNCQTNSTISKDLEELDGALKSGDLTSSKNAFAKLQRDTQSNDSSLANSLKPSNLTTDQQAYASQETYLKLIAQTHNNKNNQNKTSGYSSFDAGQNVTFTGSV
jgi:hypothetical protein